MGSDVRRNKDYGIACFQLLLVSVYRTSLVSAYVFA